MIKSFSALAREIWRNRVRLSPSLPKHLRKIMSIEGTLARGEADLLYRLASQVNTGCIVEIGSYRGKSTIALALGARVGSGAAVFAIDPHEAFVGVLGGRFGPQDRVAFFKNALRFHCVDTISLINLRSTDVASAWSEAIGLLWIDGDHSYEGVRADIDGFAGYVVTGGFLAFHDSTDQKLGPARMISELLESGTYTRFAQSDLTTVLKKQP